ncbi:MAG: hypothetical protein LBH00_11535 [Planctomycetaceae bacterium]|nr:hypothetical protein [Planctomycetaceae bacterium]
MTTASNTAFRVRSRFFGWMLSVIFVFGLFPQGNVRSAEPVRDAAFRQDVLTFSGTQNVSPDSLSSDSFLVTLNCRTLVPQPVPPRYSLILRGIDPVERDLLLDAQDGKWDRFDLFRAAMIIEGIRDPEVIRKEDLRLNALVDKVKAGLKFSGDTTPQALTKALFEAMHKEILTRPYQIDCTEISKVLKTGHFNCVSATVLFNCLADKAGLDVRALEMPGHALSRVKFGQGQSMNIETTCAAWFDLKDNAERLAATVLRVAPAPDVSNPPTANNAANPAKPETLEELTENLREISSIQLTATIYYNLGIDHIAQKRFAEAVAANTKALYLDPSNASAWKNLLVSINNWVLHLTSEKGKERFDIAATLLDQGILLDPGYANFKENQLYTFYHWIYELALRGRFSDARTVYTFANERMPDNPQLAELMQSIRTYEAKANKEKK